MKDGVITEYMIRESARRILAFLNAKKVNTKVDLERVCGKNETLYNVNGKSDLIVAVRSEETSGDTYALKYIFSGTSDESKRQEISLEVILDYDLDSTLIVIRSAAGFPTYRDMDLDKDAVNRSRMKRFSTTEMDSVRYALHQLTKTN